MTNQRMQVVGFFVLFATVLAVVLIMVLPFFKLLALAAILAIMFSPIHLRVLQRLGSKSLSALITVLLMFAILLVPLWLFGQVLFSELVSLYGKFRQNQAIFDQTALISSLPAGLQGLVQQFSQDLASRLSGLTGQLIQNATSLVVNVSGFLLAFFFVFFVFYYLLRDGDRIKAYFNSVFPLSQAHESLIVSKLEKAVSGVIKGSFLVALCQGGVGLIGYIIFGMPQPVLWAAFTVLAALVPNVGTSVALVPAILYLFLSGHTGAAAGLAIWGAFAVGTIDNFVSPKLIGRNAQLHPVLVFLGVIGGLQLFGLLGFLLGPVIMAVFMELLDIYRSDLKMYLEK